MEVKINISKDNKIQIILSYCIALIHVFIGTYDVLYHGVISDKVDLIKDGLSVDIIIPAHLFGSFLGFVFGSKTWFVIGQIIYFFIIGTFIFLIIKLIIYLKKIIFSKSASQ